MNMTIVSKQCMTSKVSFLVAVFYEHSFDHLVQLFRQICIKDCCLLLIGMLSHSTCHNRKPMVVEPIFEGCVSLGLRRGVACRDSAHELVCDIS